MNERYVNNEATREEAAKGEIKTHAKADSESIEKKDGRGPQAPSTNVPPQSADQADVKHAKSLYLLQNCKHHLMQLSQLRQRTSSRGEALNQYKRGQAESSATSNSNMAKHATSPTGRLAQRETLPQQTTSTSLTVDLAEIKEN